MRNLEIVVGILGMVFLLNVEAVSQTQDFEAVLKFEIVQTGANLQGWGGGPPETISFDSTIVHDGKGAARLECDANSLGQFTSITKRLPIGFEGHAIECKVIGLGQSRMI